MAILSYVDSTICLHSPRCFSQAPFKNKELVLSFSSFKCTKFSQFSLSNELLGVTESVRLHDSAGSPPPMPDSWKTAALLCHHIQAAAKLTVGEPPHSSWLSNRPPNMGLPQMPDPGNHEPLRLVVPIPLQVPGSLNLKARSSGLKLASVCAEACRIKASTPCGG